MDAPSVALAGYYPSEKQPYLFYKCQFGTGCSGGGGGLVSRQKANDEWLQANPTSPITNLPTAVDSTAEPSKCQPGAFSIVSCSLSSADLMSAIGTGHAGFLCGECEEGYYMLRGACNTCPDNVKVPPARHIWHQFSLSSLL